MQLPATWNLLFANYNLCSADMASVSHSSDNEEFYLQYNKPCSPVKIDQYSGVTCRLHVQFWRVNKSRNQNEIGSKQILKMEVKYLRNIGNNLPDFPMIYPGRTLLTTAELLLKQASGSARSPSIILYSIVCTSLLCFLCLSLRCLSDVSKHVNTYIKI